LVQDVVITDPEECRADALSTVAGWTDDIIEAIRNTPADRITRSRIADRCRISPPACLIFPLKP
jgi:hypothetical protein